MAVPLPKPQATEPQGSAALVRGLGTWDAALLTVGSVVGTGIFITTADMARVLPHPGLILLVWLAGGLLTLAGALTYGELGAMFPRAGGHLPLRQGGLRAALGVPLRLDGLPGHHVGRDRRARRSAFGEYLGSFLPFFSTGHVLLAVPARLAGPGRSPAARWRRRSRSWCSPASTTSGSRRGPGCRTR